MNTSLNENPAFFSRNRLQWFFVTVIQLVLLFFVLLSFNLEKGSGFNEISFRIVLPAFCIYAFVPVKFRPTILIATAFGVCYYAFGLFSGTILIITSLILIACCHLPIAFWLRVAIVILIGVGLAAIRADLFYAPRAALVVPFIGSMFMFRMIVYLYEIKHKQLKGTPTEKISYFFLFPNFCFQLFPIVDYKTAWKNFCNRPDEQNWQKGIRWMLRGMIHLFGYRIIYYFLLIGPSEVHDLPTLLQYITCSYALVLRLSGLFHFIVGVFCLFGFNLHPVFNNYFIATSFVDLWRRINIYWREFVMKVFFYPIIFRVRKKTLKHAMAITMLCSFVITWALHNYQWFWIRGYFPLTPMDILFWSVLGLCITGNSVYLERKLSHEIREGEDKWRIPLSVLKMIGIFMFMSVMWSLWGSNSLGEWVAVLSKAGIFTSTQLFTMISIFILVFVAGVIVYKIAITPKFREWMNIPPHQTLNLTALSLTLLSALTIPQIQQNLPAPITKFVISLSEERLNTADRENAERGYYKKLLDGDNEGPAGLWETNLKRPKTFTSIDEITTRTNDILLRTLKPSSKTKVNDYILETNSLGLRDKEYTMMKPDNTFRIALLGGSYEMGSGVNNDEVYEKIVEDKLNKNNTDTSYKHFEIWNYAVGAYHLLQHVELCNTRAFESHPDALIYVAHTREGSRLIDQFSELIRTGMDLKYPFLKHIKAVSGAQQTMSKTIIKERLIPFKRALIAWSYIEIATKCKEFHAIPVWAYLPATADTIDNAELKFMKEIAGKCGFVQLDLTNVYDNLDRKSIRVSEYDTHPNAQGQAIIAEKFYEELLKKWSAIVKGKK